MIKQGGADKIGVVEQKIAFTANLQMNDISMFARCTNEIPKRITVECRIG